MTWWRGIASGRPPRKSGGGDGQRRSVYETRELTWPDRLRRRFAGREDERQEPVLDERGDPVLVVAKGQPVGIRDTRGGVIEFPSDPERWPASMWEDVGDNGWIRLRRRDWWR
jgi:hypothetical protein